MEDGIRLIDEKIASFQRRYYLNLLIRGTLITLTVLVAYVVLAAAVEYFFWLGSGARLFIFGSFFGVVAFCIYRLLRAPLLYWIARQGLSREESARLIGLHFQSVQDRLLNVLQLASFSDSELAAAGIRQRTGDLQHLAFEEAVDLRGNLSYLRLLLLPFGVLFLTLLLNRDILTFGTSRIIQFHREFVPEAPFRFVIQNERLAGYYGEDFELSLQLQGDALPAEVYLVAGEQRWKMERAEVGSFRFVFERLPKSQVFRFEAGGFYSPPYELAMLNRPELLQQLLSLHFPAYLNLRPGLIPNGGNLEIPEGTVVEWSIRTAHAGQARLAFASGALEKMQSIDNQQFHIKKEFRNPDEYSLILENEDGQNKERIAYRIQVIKDQYPTLSAQQWPDTVLFRKVFVAGTIGDDYGLTQLHLHYQHKRRGAGAGQGVKRIPISPAVQQNFYYEWRLDSLQLQPGDELTYYLAVSDNDGVNGRKITRSSTFVLALPSSRDMAERLAQSAAQTEGKLRQNVDRAQRLRQSVEEVRKKMLGRQSVQWQDQQMLEDLLRQRQMLEQSIEELQREHAQLQEQQKQFDEANERIREKSEQIQELMNQLLDEETRKLFRELERLLKENADPTQLQRLLEQMNRNEINVERELERALELFKQLQFDSKLDESIRQLKEQIREQESLLEKTSEIADKKGRERNSKQNEKEGAPENAGDKSQKEMKASDLAEEQKVLQEKFQEFKESLEKLKEMGEELNRQPPDVGQQEQQEVEDAQSESQEQLEKNQPQKSRPAQQRSLQQMKKIQEKLEAQQNAMEMEMSLENLESIRHLLHGLVTLSFDQERLMKEFRDVSQTDPRYVVLSQRQVKVQDDAKVLEDSLLALAKRDPFMGSVVTREVNELNGHLTKASEQIRERRRSNAASEMQLSMTSLNNLALMLSDHFDMMMDMMSKAKPGKGKVKKSGREPNLSQLQQQLNEQMEQLMKGGKGGREMSEELARMAAEQERIRRALQEMQKKLEQQGGSLPGDLPGKMEQTEMDLVNKQLTEKTLMRQKEIMTRLLESERALREQEEDEERKGETAKDYEKEVPKAFEEYLRLKEKEVELLKTLPPRLYPYYRKEVTRYFERLGEIRP